MQAPPFSFHKPVELVIAPSPPPRPLQHSVYCILIDMRHETRRHLECWTHCSTLLSICDTASHSCFGELSVEISTVSTFLRNSKSNNTETHLEQMPVKVQREDVEVTNFTYSGLQPNASTYLPAHLPTYLHTYLPNFLSTCPPTYLSIYLHSCPPAYLATYLHIYLPTYLPTYLPALLPTYLPIYLPSCPPTYLPTCPPAHLPTYLPTYLPKYLPTYRPTYLPALLPTYLHIYLPTYLPTYLRLYSPCGPWQLIQFLNIYTKSIGLLGREISP
jgi:hypothetical protein